jgi:hypothetical protein
MSKEQQELLGEAHNNYLNKCLDKKWMKENVFFDGSSNHHLYLQQEFINKCKTDPEFSEKWGLKIEERELSLIERNNFLGDKKYTMLDGDYIWPTMIEDKEKYEKIFNETNIPIKLITITYNDKTIESYE